MKNLFLGFGIVLAAALQPLQAQIKFESFDLPNGLHVILHQDNSNPLVAVSVLYHVGSKDEIPTRTGFAHFFEHLLFEGSENIGRGEYMQLIQSNGGALNANTSNDRTFYYEILPSNQLELGLWMESERMLHAKIDQVGVDTQREVVKEEKRQRVDNQPYASFLSEMFKRAFTQHNYRWVPIGSMDDLNAATLEEFMAFYKKYYVPNNATLSIAGDIDVAQTKAMITKYFGDIPAGATVQRPSAYEPPLGGEVVDTIYDNIQIPAVFAGYRMVSETHPDTYALQMLTTALSDGPSSRFSKRMVDQDQNALQVAAFPFAMEHHGVFIALALANGATSTGTLMTTMEEEIAKMQQEPLSEKEFTKLLNKVESDYVNRNSGVAGIAENLANYHVYFGDANLINTEIERFRTVTPADLQRVAQTYLKPENRVVLHYLPKSAQ
ncbi:MAG: insulinase family protein [Schleiferiaceae bacterium]|nr:insulinase family protein [Schleiferiaceae bacterium]MDP4834054.1 insulinase family protein [Schleiferiaceae bacterium]MDP5015444.1 insulinase family protein [Schleiferiaceae bacterium]